MSGADPARLALEVDLVDETGQAGPYLELLRQIAERTVASEGLDGRYQLGITVVDDGQIRELNRVHRGQDSVTDVLSFPLLGQDGAEFVLPAEAATHLGDVALSFEQCRRQAAEYGHALERELAYLVAHGVLHLLGYDHEDESDRQAMRAREEAILADRPR